MADRHLEACEDDLADSRIAGVRLRRRWSQVAIWALLGAAIGLLVTFVRHPEYEAHASVFFPARPSVLGSNGIADIALGGTAAMLGGGASPIHIFQAFLESETAIADICGKYGFRRQDFLNHRSLDSDTRSNVLTLTFLSEDRATAERVLGSHVSELRKINSKVSFDTMQDDLKVLQSRLEDARSKMMAAQNQLVEYEKNSVTAPTITPSALGIASTPGAWAKNLIQLQLDEQKLDETLQKSKERISTLAKLSPTLPSELPPIKRIRPQLLDLEYQIAVQTRNEGPEASDVKHLEARLEVLKAQLSGELRDYLKGVNSNVIDPSVPEGELPAMLTARAVIDSQIATLRKLASAAPVESMQLNRLYAEIALQTGVVQQLTNQSLMASLQAQRDPNRWVVLDEPWTEDKPVNKSYGRGALVGIFLGFFAGVAWAVARP